MLRILEKLRIRQRAVVIGLKPLLPFFWIANRTGVTFRIQSSLLTGQKGTT